MNRKAIFEKYMKARVKEVDEKHLTPGERADLVNSFFFAAFGLDKPEDVLQQPLHWDLMCYCVEMLNAMLMASGDDQAIMAQQAVNSFIYSAHYSFGKGEPMLGPDREEHVKMWLSMIEELRGEDTDPGDRN